MTGVGAIPARAQIGDAQQLVWQCGEAAGDRGLIGAARDRFVQRCVDTDGASVRAPRPAPRPQNPAATPASGWRLIRPGGGELTLAVTSTDRAFTFALICTPRRGLNSLVHGYLEVPRGWGFTGNTTDLMIDQSTRRLQIGGSEGGVDLSDSIKGDATFLSEDTRDVLAGGQLLKIPGLTSNGHAMRMATFRIAGNTDAFAEFERRCSGVF